MGLPQLLPAGTRVSRSTYAAYALIPRIQVAVRNNNNSISEQFTLQHNTNASPGHYNNVGISAEREGSVLQYGPGCRLPSHINLMGRIVSIVIHRTGPSIELYCTVQHQFIHYTITIKVKRNMRQNNPTLAKLSSTDLVLYCGVRVCVCSCVHLSLDQNKLKMAICPQIKMAKMAKWPKTKGRHPKKNKGRHPKKLGKASKKK